VESRIIYPPDKTHSEAWVFFDNGEYVGPLWPYSRYGQGGGLNYNSTYYKPTRRGAMATGDTLDTVVMRIAAGLTISKPTINPGEFHPRVWRSSRNLERFGDSVLWVEKTPFYSSFINSLEQIEGLLTSLADIFRVVHGDTRNLEVFGTAIRDIIILACTEVENQWKAVLVANGAATIDDRLSTVDYVRIAGPMKLHDYSVGLSRYPHVSEIRPFSGWIAASPSKSMPWYEAYNKVKHNREVNFSEAKLLHAIEAVAACVVMLAAQFGAESLRRHQLPTALEFRNRPTWEPEDCYYGPVPDTTWSPQPFTF
jgi:hypothetical protein